MCGRDAAGLYSTICGYNIVVSISACHALCAGSNPATRSKSHGDGTGASINILVGFACGRGPNGRTHRNRRSVMVGVVQLARTPDCGSGGRGFKPRLSPQYTSLAQLD